MGYAELAADVWVSPFPRRELTSVLAHSNASARTAHADRFDPPPTEAWDLTALRAAYDAWPAAAEAIIERHERAQADPDKAAFAARFHLVHEWRKFLFADPGLPDELLPDGWPGRTASDAFDAEATRLKPGRRPLRGPLPESRSGRLHRMTATRTGPPRPRRRRRHHQLNRPDAMNSLDVATKEALLKTVQSVAEDPAARCVVLTGTGRAFCVGQDLKEHIEILNSESSEALFRTVDEHYNPIVTALASMPKPVLAAVNGVAAGAGASLAFACDLRILADSAGFNLAFANVALSCDTGASYHLQRLVGRAKAIELLYFPTTISAEDSLVLGLANRVVPASDLEATVQETAARLANGPTVALGAMRRSVAYAAGHSFEEALEFESRMMQETGATRDHEAAVAAFVAKEKPVFEGR